MVAGHQLFLQEERRAPSPPQSLTVHGLARRGPGQEWRDNMPGMLAKGPCPLPSTWDCMVGGQTTCPLDQEPCGWVVGGVGIRTGKAPLYQAGL